MKLNACLFYGSAERTDEKVALNQNWGNSEKKENLISAAASFPLSFLLEHSTERILRGIHEILHHNSWNFSSP